MILPVPELFLSTSLIAKSISSRANSREAQYVAQKCEEGRARLQESVYFGSVFDELSAIYEQCREQNWDGYGAAAVKETTYLTARQLLELLWFRTPTPSIAVDADGDLTFEWHLSPQRTLSVSVSAEGNLHYAALIGDAHPNGAEFFSGEVPTTIVDLVLQVYAA